MKEGLRQQIGDLLPGQIGWENFMSDCISAGICPNCGNELYPGVVDKDYGEVALFGCSQCEWLNYMQVAPRSADRHGLV